MILLTALLFSVSAGCVLWIVMRRYESRHTISGRISKLTQAAPVYGPPEPLVEGIKKKDTEISSTIKTDRMTRDLFLAGIRSNREVKFYHFLLKLSVIVPAALLLLYTVTGNLTGENAMRVGCIGFAIMTYTRFTIKRKIAQRKKRILRELPQFLDMLVVCMEAGLNFTAAVDRMLKEVNSEEPLAKEFVLMYQEFLGGFSLQQACERMEKRCDVSDLTVILNAIVQSDQMGSSLGSTLRIQAEELRDKYRQRMRERAYRIPIKILFPTMLIFFTIFLMTLGPVFFQINKVLSKTQA